MEPGLFNISSATTTTLIDSNTSGGNIRSVSICNCNQDEAVKVRLFLSDGTNDTSFLEDLNIPGGVTLVMTDVGYDGAVLALKLQTQGTGVDVNVIIR
jgi:hypothetical protein|tara:strand:- start:190 stop:483 length:294 start_codon:yes stop_codon:yes gene_type:complete